MKFVCPKCGHDEDQPDFVTTVSHHCNGQWRNLKPIPREDEDG